MRLKQSLKAKNIERIKARQSEICFKDFEDDVKSAGVKFQTKMLISRNVYRTIIDEIEIQNPDIVVMGSHGLTWLKKLLLGSVSAEVLKKSTAPVLIVK